MQLHMYIYMCIYIYMYITMNLTSTCKCKCTCIHVYMYLHLHINVHLHVHLHVHTHASCNFMYTLHLHVPYVYMYIYTNSGNFKNFQKSLNCSWFYAHAHEQLITTYPVLEPLKHFMRHTSVMWSHCRGGVATPSSACFTWCWSSGWTILYMQRDVRSTCKAARHGIWYNYMYMYIYVHVCMYTCTCSCWQSDWMSNRVVTVNAAL